MGEQRGARRALRSIWERAGRVGGREREDKRGENNGERRREEKGGMGRSEHLMAVSGKQIVGIPNAYTSRRPRDFHGHIWCLKTNSYNREEKAERKKEV